MSIESESVKRLKAKQDENAPIVTGSEIKIRKQNEGSSDSSNQSHTSLKSEE